MEFDAKNNGMTRRTIPLIKLQDELGDMIHAVEMIPRLLRYFGEYDGGNRGLDASECDMLGTILACYTDALDHRYAQLVDKAYLATREDTPNR